MKQSELDYKQETGLAASEWKRILEKDDNKWLYATTYNDKYIEWLEEKYDELLKERQVHHNKKT